MQQRRPGVERKVYARNRAPVDHALFGASSALTRNAMTDLRRLDLLQTLMTKAEAQ